MSRRVAIVTGASGFVGRHVLRPLAAAGFEVHALGRRPVQGAVFHAADLFDRSAVRAVLDAVRPTHLLHCAWTVEHGRFWTAPENLDWVAATLTLARDFAAAGGTRMVGVGTCMEYDWSDGGAAPRREGDPLRPVSLYAAAKAATCSVLSAFAAGAGLSFAWARLFHLHGRDEPPARLVPSIAAALVEGREAVCRAGGLARDLMETRDAGRALAALTACGLDGPVNVASGRAVPLAEIAAALGRLAGRPDLVRIGDAPPAPGEPAVMCADTGRLRAILDPVATIPLEAGLADAIAALRERDAGRPTGL